MYPNWHGKPYFRLLWFYGVSGLWYQFWYDVKNWSVLGRRANG